MKESVLITGANGFIGSHLVETALDRDYEVTVFVRQHSHLGILEELNIKVIRVDYLKPEDILGKLTALDHDFDLVIHCAGVIEAKDERGFEEGNVTVTKNLLNALLESEKLAGKFIYFSSLAARGPYDEYMKHNSDYPISTYGRSKLKGEKLVISSDFPHLIVRPTAVYGPRDMAFLELIKTIDKRLEVTLGNKRQKLTMIHARDLAEMTFTAAYLEEEMIYGYDGKTYTQSDISLAVKKALGGKKTVKFPISKNLFMGISLMMNGITRLFLRRNWKYTPEKVDELVADDWSISDPLPKGIQTRYTLEAGFQNMVAWYWKLQHAKN